MSRSGNRVTPASGRAGAAPGWSTSGPDRARSAAPPALRWWPRARPRARSQVSGAAGRWGVARLVAQREAELRAAEEPAGPEDEVAETAVPDGRAPAPEHAPAADDEQDAVGIPAAGAASDPSTAGSGCPSDDAPATDDVLTDDALTDTPVTDDAACDEPVADDAACDEPVADAPVRDGTAEPEDVPPPRAPLPPGPAVPPSPRPPLRTPLPVPRPPLPVPRRPHGVRSGPVVANASDGRASRPRVEPDLALFGFARHTRGRLGGRVFTLFFVLVFALIIVQTIASIV